MQIKEKNIEEIEHKLAEMNTELNKIAYLEVALKADFTFQIKRYIWGRLAGLYEEKKMLDKAAKAMSNKAGIEVAFKDKVESYLKAAEIYAKMGKIDDADLMFLRASRQDGGEKVKLAMKNIYKINAENLEKQGKKRNAMLFYERLLKMNLEDMEEREVREKLKEIYKSLGMFREANLLK
ncbi:MAG: hypothetical protein ACP5D2_01865 [Candidatus Nanoarchaeia archaeon]